MKEKVFKVEISGKEFDLTRENVDVYIHRPPEFQDLDYLRIFDFDNEVATCIFRLQEMCRMMGGVAFNENGFPVVPAFKGGETFKDRFGWFADTYLLTEPSKDAIEGYSMVEADHDISPDGSWSFDE